MYDHTSRLILSLRLTALLLLILHPVSAEEIPTPVIEEGTTAVGQLTVSPTWGTAAQYGTWIVTYAVGSGGIEQGGGVRVQLPDAWHAGPRNSANRLQTSDPRRDHYVRAVSSNPNTVIKTIVESEREGLLIKHAKLSLDGRRHRYTFVVRAIVSKGKLDPDDTISVIYGDRTGGSPGIRASAVSPKHLPLLAALDVEGNSRFTRLEHQATIESRPGSAVEMLFHLPSQGVAGKPLRGIIALVDAEGNPIDHSTFIGLYAETGNAEFPSTVTVPPGKGHVRFEIIPKTTGVIRLRARTKVYELETVSNPARIVSKPLQENIYWGDLHSHTHFSWDGVGHDQYDYARYTSGLDFYAMTDHATDDLEKVYSSEYIKLPDQYNDPPNFVALHAYEISFGKPWGHHNIFFRSQPGPMVLPAKTSLPKIWETLSKGQALTIPHHTGKFPQGVDFSVENPDFRRNFEIYSAHGLSEVYNPLHPLAFEHSLFTSDAKSLKTPTHAQDVWRQGLQLSAIGSSDDHRAHPGQPHYGLAAVRAPRLTRDAIFQGLYKRHTYAVTGAKIILDFTLNGQPMGETVSLESNPLLEIEAVGTDAIEWVELLRILPNEATFGILHTWRPASREFKGRYTDKDYQPGAIYYVRLKQKYKIRNRIVMAWSSPIWTQVENR